VRIQKRYWFSLAALALIGLIVFLSLPPAEPIVKGRPLGYWLDQIHAENIESSSQEFRSALPEMNDRCIPWLIDELNWKPSLLLRKTGELSRKWFHIHLEAEPPDRRAEAALLLGWFGPRASNAIPALENLSRFHGGDPEKLYVNRATAIAALTLIRHDSMEICARKSINLADSLYPDYQYAIESLGTNATPCVPIFIDAIKTSTNAKVRILAAWSLGLIHSRPDLSLPVLTPMLNETNPSRDIVVYAVSLFGSAAKPAWNDLIPLLKDPDENVRLNTTNVLWKIDSTAAKQFGISGPMP